MNDSRQSVGNTSTGPGFELPHGLEVLIEPPPLELPSTVVGLVTGVIGMCANAVVLAVLIFARH